MTEVRDYSKRFLAVAENAIEKAVARGTIKIQREAKRLIGQYKSPPPSAPGEPPHQLTGTLIRFLNHEQFRDGRDFVGRVGYETLKYARYLELGTARMAARPYLRPALDSQIRQIQAEIRKAGGEMVRRAKP